MGGCPAACGVIDNSSAACSDFSWHPGDTHALLCFGECLTIAIDNPHGGRSQKPERGLSFVWRRQT